MKKIICFLAAVSLTCAVSAFSEPPAIERLHEAFYNDTKIPAPDYEALYQAACREAETLVPEAASGSAQGSGAGANSAVNASAPASLSANANDTAANAATSDNAASLSVNAATRHTAGANATAAAEAVKSAANAWCKYLMARILSQNGNNAEAEKLCDECIQQAEAALKAEGLSANEKACILLVKTDGIALNCNLKPFSYMLAHGLDVKKYAEEVLELSPKCGPAVFLAGAQLVYAPAPFNNYKKGAAYMISALNDPKMQLSKTDIFDFSCAAATCLLNSKHPEDALPYLEKAASIFPDNAMLKGLLADYNRIQ